MKKIRKILLICVCVMLAVLIGYSFDFFLYAPVEGKIVSIDPATDDVYRFMDTKTVTYSYEFRRQSYEGSVNDFNGYRHIGDVITIRVDPIRPKTIFSWFIFFMMSSVFSFLVLCLLIVSYSIRRREGGRRNHIRFTDRINVERFPVVYEADKVEETIWE